MAALPPLIPYRPIAPFQALDGASPAARAGNHARFASHAHTVHADARRENQNVARNASMSTKVNSPGSSENGVCRSEGGGGRSSSGRTKGSERFIK